MTHQNISKKILHWYDNNKRALPWRKTVSKRQREYFTLVSEFMLQQTQVKTVIPYFNNFISKIPNLTCLALVKDNKLTVSDIMTCTLSVDHRSIDGAIASQFLNSIKLFIENPVLLLI